MYKKGKLIVNNGTLSVFIKIKRRYSLIIRKYQLTVTNCYTGETYDRYYDTVNELKLDNPVASTSDILEFLSDALLRNLTQNYFDRYQSNIEGL